MKSLRAKVTLVPHADRRGAGRMRVDLLVTLPPDQDQRYAHVRNLSEGGMLLETDADLNIGDLLSVNCDGVLKVDARIVWRQEQSYGCQFLEPITSAAVSAAILRAPVELPDEADTVPKFEEFPIGFRPTVDEIAAWKTDFNKTYGSRGLRLVAFRQTEGGLMIAIVSAA